MIRLRIDGPGSAAYFVAQFSDSGTVVRNVYRRLRQQISANEARHAIVAMAIAVGEVAE